MSFRLTLHAAAVAPALMAGPAHGQKPDRAKPGSGEPPAAAAVTAGFTDQERGIIMEYFRQHRTAVKPLPPGIVKNLARGKPLPSGIARQRIPADLRRRLPPREGVEITIFGDRVVLLQASGLVVDILAGVFR
jgi:hypothetical protein